MGEVKLPSTGTYTLAVYSTGGNTGSGTINLYNVVNITATINSDGTATNFSLTTPWQLALLTFSGTTGQSVSALMSNSTIANSSLCLAIQEPTGAFLSDVCDSSPLGPVTLPTTGTYTLWLFPWDGSTGNVAVALYNVVNFTGTITPSGSSVTLNFTSPGQQTYLTFTGSAGQTITVVGMNSNFPYCEPYGELFDANGNVTAGTACLGTSGSIGPTTLSILGTYTLEVWPSDDSLGTITVAVSSQ
jgi:hypothetical protein